MRFSRRFQLVALLGLLLLCGPSSQGQEDDPSGGPVGPEGALPAARRTAVEEVEPPVYWLEDNSGRLQPVIKFPLEEFTRLLKLGQALDRGPEVPPYSLVELSLAGVVQDDVFRGEARFRIRVQADDWVRVPLRLDEAILRGRPSYDGPGEHVLMLDEGASSYVGWLKGRSDEAHLLRLQVLVPLKRSGNEQGIKLTLPRAPTSQLELDVPGTGVVLRASEGMTLESTPDHAEQRTRLVALGLPSEFELWWRAAENQMAAAPTTMDATGNVLARVDSRSVSTEAALKVKSRGGPLKAFQVRLPADSRLISGTGSGCVVHPAEPASEPGDDEPQATLIDVQVEDRGREEVELRLITEQAHDPTQPNQVLDFAGFEVLGAIRQSGFLAVHALGDWQVNWGRRRSVRQVATEELPADLRGNDLAAGFEYLNQPCVLQGRIIPRRSRVGVDPLYVFFVESDRLVVQARLKYTIGGARVFALEVSLPEVSVDHAVSVDSPNVPGKEAAHAEANRRETAPIRWEIDEIGPASLVDLRGVFLDELTPLSIPLLQPATGEVELTFRAHVPFPRNPLGFEVALPRPIANTLGPAAVVLAPADNIEIEPRSQRIQNLSRQLTMPEVELPPRQQPPLAYRGDVARGVLATDLRVREREVSAAVASRVFIAGRDSTVSQQFDYEIAYEPLDALEFRVPARVADSRQLDVRVDGRIAKLLVSREPLNSAEAQGDLVRGIVPLPAERLGRVRVTLGFPLEHDPLVPDASVVFDASLVMPHEVALTGNDLLVAADANVRVEHLDEAWSLVAQDGAAVEGKSLRLASDEPLTLLRLAANLEESTTAQATLVDRAWIQTWLGTGERQDRVAYRLTSSADLLTVRIPQQAVEESADVVVNGEPIEIRVQSDGTLMIPLRQKSGRDQYVIDIRYSAPTSRRTWGRLALKAPELDGAVRVRRSIWQLVLPRDEHVVAGPVGYTGEFEWGWNVLYWGRRPLLEQFELENWVGVARRTAPGRGTNRYLFSTLGRAQEIEVHTAARWLLVLAASGTALVAGLCLIYVPAVRRPGALLLVVLAVGSLGALYPEQTLMFVQAAGAGLVLTLVAGLLERGVARRRRTRPAGRASGSSVVESPSHRSLAGVGSSATTEVGRLEMDALPPPFDS